MDTAANWLKPLQNMALSDQISRVIHMQAEPDDKKMTPIGQNPDRAVDSSKGRPYNPVIASGRGAKRLRDLRQTTEITKQLAVYVDQDLGLVGVTRGDLENEKRVLTVLRDLSTTRLTGRRRASFAPTVPVFLKETIWLPGNRDVMLFSERI